MSDHAYMAVISSIAILVESRNLATHDFALAANRHARFFCPILYRQLAQAYRFKNVIELNLLKLLQMRTF